MPIPRLNLITATVVLALGAVTQPAIAQNVGVSTGIQLKPDQFSIGAHVETPPLIDRLVFRPSLEISPANSWTSRGAVAGAGTGADSVPSRNPAVLAFNFEFAYHLASNRPWHFYVGGGPGLVLTKARGGTVSGGGANLLLGAQYSRGLFVEVRKGFAESPSMKFAAGYSTRLKLKWR